MSGGAGESRVPIPSSVRKTIQNIKEIAGNHSEDEVYAMLKECGMDPNETTQRLLFQDTFHVVKGKRNKKKENIGNKEFPDAGWRVGGQGRGGRGNRGSYSSRFITNDATGVKNLPVGKETGANQGADKDAKTAFAVHDAESKPSSKLNSVPVLTNGDIKVTFSEGNHSSEISHSGSVTSSITDINSENEVLISDAHGKSIFSAKQSSLSTGLVPKSGVLPSAFNAAPIPSLDNNVSFIEEIIDYDAGSEGCTVVEPKAVSVSHDVAAVEQPFSVSDETIASRPNISYLKEKLSNKSQKEEVNHLAELSQGATIPVSLESKPSSNYINRPQPITVQQKVGSNKEWKPKQLKPGHTKSFDATGASEIISATTEIGSQSPPIAPNTLKDTFSKIHKKSGDLQFSDRKHVIFPNHIHVPEADRAGLSFGSFDAFYGQKISSDNELAVDKESTAGSGQDLENAKKSPKTKSTEVEVEATPDHPQSPQQMPEAVSSDTVEISSSSPLARELEQSKPESTMMADASPGPSTSQYSAVQTLPTYSTYGLVAPVFGGQIATFENPESQGHDASDLPTIVVQQPTDLSTSYYTQLYHANSDSDDRVPPVVAPGTTSLYNGHSAVLSIADQSSQENGSSTGQSTTGQASVGNQGAGVMQSSIPVQQNPISVFRQPAGLHLTHYPPNFIPYSQYYPPFYLPPPSIHPFLSNPTFPQQHQAGSIYPPAPVTPGAASIKFSLPQFKAGGNNGSTAHAGSTTGFGLYNPSLTNYNPISATSIVNSTGNEDLVVAPQYKENNVYIAGQQSEGSTVWIPAPGRDIPGLQANSFYNISPQGQHVAFSPMQAGHAAFPGVYYPTQTAAGAAMHPLLQQSQAIAGAVEMVAPPTGVYQQPQRTQVNWTNNY